MAAIVCATRGGQGSRAGRTIAIQRAKELNAKLFFLFVVDPSRLAGMDEQTKAALRAESNWLGRALVNIAAQQAEAFGVSSELLIKEGNFKEQVAIVAKERQADLIILGASRGASSTVFGDDAVEQFAKELQEQVNIRVEIAHPEDLELTAAVS